MAYRARINKKYETRKIGGDIFIILIEYESQISVYLYKHT